MQILLVYKYNKTGNGNSKTAKRKSRTSSFLKRFNLGGLFRGPFLGMEVFLVGFKNLVREYTFIQFQKIYFYYQDPLNFADVSIFLIKGYC